MLKLTVNFWTEKDGTVSGSIPELSLSINGEDKDNCIENLWSLSECFSISEYFSDDKFPDWFKHNPSLFAYCFKCGSTPQYILFQEWGYSKKKYRGYVSCSMPENLTLFMDKNKRGEYVYSYMYDDMPESLKTWKIKHELHMTPKRFAEAFKQ